MVISSKGAYQFRNITTGTVNLDESFGLTANATVIVAEEDFFIDSTMGNVTVPSWLTSSDHYLTLLIADGQVTIVSA